MDKTRKQKRDKIHPRLEQAVVFFFVWMGVAALTFGFFKLIDFLPESPTPNEQDAPQEARALTEIPEDVLDLDEEMATSETMLPEMIIFDTLGKEIPIINPRDTSVAVLDNALLSGVVRHPESADFLNTGTIFLLGHSSYLPVVHNKNFQAFNGIQDLEWGDTIRLRSADSEYVYTIDRVYEAQASDAMVPIEYGTPTLTLATCNSFGTKDDRYIVEASLVSKHKLSAERSKITQR